MKKPNASYPLGPDIPDHVEIVSYLNGSIDAEMRRSLEVQFTEDEFLGDAIEGLKEIQSASELNSLHSSVAYSIKRNLKKSKSKNSYVYPIWMIILTMGLIFTVVVAGYWIISLLLNN